jgi:hypothetical protein
MATLTAAHLASLDARHSRHALKEALKPIVESYFPGGTIVELVFDTRNLMDSNHAPVSDLIVYDNAWNIVAATSDDYRHHVQKLNKRLYVIGDDNILLDDDETLPTLAIDGNTFKKFFPEGETHVTPLGTFVGTCTAAMLIEKMSHDDITDILELDTAADALDWVDMTVAYAVLDNGGFEAVKDELATSETTLHELLSGVPDLEGFAVHLAKLALVAAVKIVHRERGEVA